jgi:hypothetical protein
MTFKAILLNAARGLHHWICDGGCLRWSCLARADKNSSDPMVAALAGIHGGVRKDVGFEILVLGVWSKQRSAR